MFQVTFSDQSLEELNSLNQSAQLLLMEKLSSLTSDILSGENSGIGSFIRNGKTFYRLRIDDLRVYFEKINTSFFAMYQQSFEGLWWSEFTTKRGSSSNIVKYILNKNHLAAMINLSN